MAHGPSAAALATLLLLASLNGVGACQASDMLTSGECQLLRRAVPGDMELCYSAREHGWCQRCIHRNCDDRGASIVIATVKGRGLTKQAQGVEGRVFGGFTTRNLRFDDHPKGGYKSDTDAWLFRFIDGKLERAFAKDDSRVVTGTANQNLCLGFGSHDLDINGPDCKSGLSIPRSFQLPSSSWLAGCEDCWELQDLEVYTVHDSAQAIRECTWSVPPSCQGPGGSASSCASIVDEATCVQSTASVQCDMNDIYVSEVYNADSEDSLLPKKDGVKHEQFLTIRNLGNLPCNMAGWKMEGGDKEPIEFAFGSNVILPPLGTWRSGIGTNRPLSTVCTEQMGCKRISQPEVSFKSPKGSVIHLVPPTSGSKNSKDSGTAIKFQLRTKVTSTDTAVQCFRQNGAKASCENDTPRKSASAFLEQAAAAAIGNTLDKCKWGVRSGECSGTSGCDGLEQNACINAQIPGKNTTAACFWGPAKPRCHGATGCEWRRTEGSCKAFYRDCQMHRTKELCESAPPHLSFSAQPPLKGKMVKCKWGTYFDDGAGDQLQCFEDDQVLPTRDAISQTVKAGETPIPKRQVA